MRQSPAVVWVIAAVLIGLAGIGSAAMAQDGTPSAGGFEIAPGVTAEALAFAAGQENPALYRLTFAPGVSYRVEPAPDFSLVYQESGVLTAILDAPVTIVRAGSAGATGEVIAAGTEYTLAAGDYAVLPPLIGGEVRNDGQEAASVQVATIVPSVEGTPVP